MIHYESLGKPHAITIGLPALHPLRLTLRGTSDSHDTATVVVFFTPDAWNGLKEFERAQVVHERVAPLLSLPREDWASSPGWKQSEWPDIDFETTVDIKHV